MREGLAARDRRRATTGAATRVTEVNDAIASEPALGEVGVHSRDLRRIRGSRRMAPELSAPNSISEWGRRVATVSVATWPPPTTRRRITWRSRRTR